MNDWKNNLWEVFEISNMKIDCTYDVEEKED